jgi:hypothetical protein
MAGPVSDTGQPAVSPSGRRAGVFMQADDFFSIFW